MTRIFLITITNEIASWTEEKQNKRKNYDYSDQEMLRYKVEGATGTFHAKEMPNKKKLLYHSRRKQKVTRFSLIQNVGEPVKIKIQNTKSFKHYVN